MLKQVWKRLRTNKAQYDMDQKIELKYADLENQQYQKYQNSFAHNAVGWFIVIGGLLGIIGFAFISATVKEQRRRRL